MATQINIASTFKLQGTNYLSVLANGTPAQNGQAVRDAYTAAIALNPNGVAKSATNRVVILLAPGYYTFDEATLGSPFTINQSFIDFESLSGMTDVYFSSMQVLSYAPGINVRISGIDTTKNNYYSHGAFAVASTAGGSENIYIKNCVGGDYSFASFSSGFIGTIDGCTAANYSFGYVTNAAPMGITQTGSAFSLYGTFKNCQANNYSFIASQAGSFFGDINNYGTIDNCIANAGSFGYSDNTGINQAGTISNCVSTGDYTFCVSFGAGSIVTNYGTIVNCRGRLFSFIVTFDTLANAENFGNILNCDSTSYDGCFVSDTGGFYTGSNFGRISNCTAYSSIGAFCGDKGVNLGYISNCVAGSKAFCCDTPGNIQSDIFRCTMTSDTFTVGATGGGRVVLGIDTTGVVNY